MKPTGPGSDPVFLAAYGEVIKRLRDAKGLERRELAEVAGVSYSYLSAIESGQKLPSRTVQNALAKALSIKPPELLAMANGEVEATPPPTTTRHNLGPPVDEPMRYSASVLRQTGARMAAPMPEEGHPRSASPEMSPTGALAELQALVPTLSPEDAAMLVSMARRLASAPEPTPTPADQRQHHGRRGSRLLRTQAYLEFWTTYLAELDRRDLDWTGGRTPEPRSYFTTSSPIRGASLSASFARNRQLRHELYINRGSRTANLELLHDLEAHRTVLETAYGQQLDFEDPGPERRAVRIAKYRDGHISREGEHREYIDWFIDHGTRMRRALDAYVAARRHDQ